MKNFKLILQYDGTRYLGWQRPEKDGYHKTVSFRIASVLRRMTGEDITLHAGASTEPGVHALAQTVSFRTASGLPADEIFHGLNRYLPLDIAVRSCEEMPERFQADLGTVSRTYEYRVCTEPVYDIFSARYTDFIFPGPDVTLMERAAGYLTGTHDFRNFSGSRKKKGTVKTILDIRFSRTDALIITMTADGFLNRMPSLLIGALLETGLKKRPPESIINILEGKEKAEALCNPKGLLLRSIQYHTINIGK